MKFSQRQSQWQGPAALGPAPSGGGGPVGVSSL